MAARTAAEALVDIVEGTGPPAVAERRAGRDRRPARGAVPRLARKLAARKLGGLRVEEATDVAYNPDADAVESGALLPSPHAVLAGPTFAEWLDAQAQVAAA